MPNKKYKVLLAEDDEFLQRMYATKLISSGFEVIAASDGEQALEKALSQKSDLVLLDLLMPKKSGFDVLKELRASKEFKNLPIIVLTNLNEPDDIKKAKEFGANEYVVKAHFLPSEVIALLEKYITK